MGAKTHPLVVACIVCVGAVTPERMGALRSIFKQMAEEKGDSDSVCLLLLLLYFSILRELFHARHPLCGVTAPETTTTSYGCRPTHIFMHKHKHTHSHILTHTRTHIWECMGAYVS